MYMSCLDKGISVLNRACSVVLGTWGKWQLVTNLPYILMDGLEMALGCNISFFDRESGILT